MGRSSIAVLVTGGLSLVVVAAALWFAYASSSGRLARWDARQQRVTETGWVWVAMLIVAPAQLVVSIIALVQGSTFQGVVTLGQGAGYLLLGLMGRRRARSRHQRPPNR